MRNSFFKSLEKTRWNVCLNKDVLNESPITMWPLTQQTNEFHMQKNVHSGTLRIISTATFKNVWLTFCYCQYYFRLLFTQPIFSGDHSRLGQISTVFPKRTFGNCWCKTSLQARCNRLTDRPTNSSRALKENNECTVVTGMKRPLVVYRVAQEIVTQRKEGRGQLNTENPVLVFLIPVNHPAKFGIDAESITHTNAPLGLTPWLWVSCS